MGSITIKKENILLSLVIKAFIVYHCYYYYYKIVIIFWKIERNNS